MKILENKTEQDLLNSAIAEAAKAANELKCAKGDIEKAQSRLNFILVLLNTLQERNID
jgi:hypothetical protein